MENLKTTRIIRFVLEAAKKHCVLTDQTLYKFVSDAVVEKLEKEGYKNV